MELAAQQKTSTSLSQRWRETLFVRAFAFTKVPLMYFARPSVRELTDSRCVVRLKLSRRTKNHVGSMYFGALSIGADLAGGLIAMKLIRDRKARVQLLFKDFHADFLARAEGDVFFTCEEGAEVRRAIDETVKSGERVNLPVHVVATVPDKRGDEPVARFRLTMSLKRK